MRINPRIKGVLHLKFIFGNTNILGDLLFVPRQTNFLLNEVQKMHF